MREKDREAKDLYGKNVQYVELIRAQIEKMKERFEIEKTQLVKNSRLDVRILLRSLQLTATESLLVADHFP